VIVCEGVGGASLPTTTATTDMKNDRRNPAPSVAAPTAVASASAVEYVPAPTVNIPQPHPSALSPAARRPSSAMT
jgi:hypothetical protein